MKLNPSKSADYKESFMYLKGYFMDRFENNVPELVSLIKTGFDSTKSSRGSVFVGGNNNPDFSFLEKYNNIPTSFGNQNNIIQDAAKTMSGMMRWHHPGTLQNITPTPSLISVAASVIVNVYNPNLIWDYVSGGLQKVERQIVKQFSEYFNWSVDTSGGAFTFGGKACHMYAIRIGLNRAIQDYSQKGIQKNEVAIITTKFNHYILESAASMLGIGKENCVRLDTYSDETIDVNKFKDTLEDLFSRNVKVPCIILSGGSTINLNIDPVLEIKKITLDLTKKFNLSYVPFIYFDIVVGFPWIFFKKYNFDKNHLKIEKDIKDRISKVLSKILEAEFADGVGIDFHKSGFCPYANSLFIAKNGIELHSMINADQNFLQEKEYGSNFSQVYTIEHSRSGTSILSAWCTLQSIGEIGFQSFIAYTISCGDVFRRILPGYGFELVNDISLTYSPLFFATHPKLRAKNYKDLVEEADIESVIENTNYLYKLTQYMAQNESDELLIDVGFIKQYLESKCGVRHSAIRIFPMAIDKTIEDCEKIAHAMGAKKSRFDKVYQSSGGCNTPEVIHR